MPRIPIRHVTRASALTLAVVAALAACAPADTASDPQPTPSTPATPRTPEPAAAASTVTIREFRFNPAAAAVPAGTTVTWVNEEDSLHTVTAGTPEAPSTFFDSGEIDTGVTFAFTFDEAGTYPFFCARHDFMTGEIVVEP